jgi:enoyl-CoA hydratase
MNENDLLVQDEGAVRIITLNRPERLNSFTKPLLEKLGDAFQKAKTDSSCRALILTGAGSKAFSCGADIHTFLAEKGQALGVDWARLGQTVFAMLDDLGKPTIAAINGLAYGGAFELALACTFRIASEDARFSFPEINLGFLPGWGGTQRATRILGQDTALELILTGAAIDASQALALGIVSRVVPANDLMRAAGEMAGSIAAKPPLAVRFALEAILRGQDMALNEGLRLESGLAAMAVLSEDAREGITAFLEKRKPPVFKGC